MAFEITSVRANHIAVTAFVLAGHLGIKSEELSSAGEILDLPPVLDVLVPLLSQPRFKGQNPGNVSYRDIEKEIQEEIKQTKKFLIKREAEIVSQCN